MLDLVKELCSLDGTSGREENVREYIINKIEGKCEYKVDPLGNILAFKKGKETPKNKVMLSAHILPGSFPISRQRGYSANMSRALAAGTSCSESRPRESMSRGMHKATAADSAHSAMHSQRPRCSPA